MIPLVVHPSEAVQEGFDVRFCFIGRIRLCRRIRFLCCRLRSGDLEEMTVTKAPMIKEFMSGTHKIVFVRGLASRYFQYHRV